MTPFVAFGYRKTKTDKHKLEIDPSAGGVVQDIFKMKLQGMSQDAIANRLNELGILSPFEYKISSGSRYETGFRQKEQALWSSVTVRRILENEVYIGNLVQGKRTTPNHKVKQTYVKPEDDWIRIEKNHEPLVSDRDFEIVQRLLGMDTRTSPDQKQVYLLSGIAVCADCGAPMTRKVSTVAGKKYAYYLCFTNIVGDGTPGDIFGDIQLLQDVKMDIPPVVELGMRLKRRGIELDTPILREQDMIEAIEKLYRMKCGGSEDAER